MSFTAAGQQLARFRRRVMGEEVVLRGLTSGTVASAPVTVNAEFKGLSLEQRLAIGTAVDRVQIAELELGDFAINSEVTLTRAGGNRQKVLSEPAPQLARYRGATFWEFFLGGASR